MDEFKHYEVLLKEYAEAGAACRNAEQLTRTSLSIFIPLATFLVGAVAAAGFDPTVKLALSLAGFVYAILLANTVHRQSLYYFKYVARAKEIESLIKNENTPVMALYTQGASATLGSRTISNKLAIAAVFWLAAVYFAGAALWHARIIYCSHVL